MRENSKPILVVANKIDKENGLENLVRLKEKYNNPIIPCSALAEYILRKYHEDKIIKYIPGLNNFQIINHQKLKPKELETLEKIRGKILGELNETGVQSTLNHAIFKIANQICVFPVSDINTFTDHDDNVLPDVFLVEKGTTLKDFIQHNIHTDLAEHFMFGIDALTKKRLGENYELKHNNVIKIVSSR